MIVERLQRVGIIILAAGLGTRMNSDKAKVLHEINGKPMILYVVATAEKTAGQHIVVVVGHQSEIVQKIVSETYNVKFALQQKQLGTGHAVMKALPHLADDIEDVIVLCGDVPLISAMTLKRLFQVHQQQKRDITIIGVDLEKPGGYGRLIINKKKQVSKIVEEKDATCLQKKITIVNTGIYCVKKTLLNELLPKIKPNNAQNEYYFTDIIEIAYQKNKTVGLFLSENQDEFMGINTAQELEFAQVTMKKMRSG
jgi:bifunctional UDP-N-acetylglucosamine pyrophosphorylase/glucosamine-1-phosphate N-acetyltransferase/UDP-N-acetylglucosamine pyrophosphorylase